MIWKTRAKRRSRKTANTVRNNTVMCFAVVIMLFGAVALPAQEELEQLSFTDPCITCLPERNKASGQFGDREKNRIGGLNNEAISYYLQDLGGFLEYPPEGKLERFYPGNESWYRIQCLSPDANRRFGDKYYQEKTAAIRQAIKALTDRRVDTTLLWGAVFNCSNDPTVPSQVIKRANKRGDRFIPENVFHFGPTLASPMTGRDSSVAAKLGRGSGLDRRTRTIDILHMIGHLLYERDQTDSYYDLRRRAATASRVSEYAQKNMNEFVAEVFAGIMIGHQWPSDVLDEYDRAWKPKTR